MNRSKWQLYPNIFSMHSLTDNDAVDTTAISSIYWKLYSDLETMHSIIAAMQVYKA